MSEEKRAAQRPHSLFHDPNYTKLWIGQTAALFGTQVTALALSLTAATALQATSSQMGILDAARTIPFLLIALFAGVWIDRCRKRPILVATNLMKALLLGLIPLFAVLGVLCVEHLYIIAFATGVLTVFFDLAHVSILPTLVQPEQLVEANSKLMVSSSAAEISGQSFVGAIVEFLTAPFAFILDSVSLLLSALGFGLINKPEDVRPRKSEGSLVRDLTSGIGIVFRNSYLRALALSAATYNLFEQIITTVIILYVTRDLGLGPAVLTFILATSSIGGVIGSLAADRVARRLGTGPAILTSMLIGCFITLLIPLAVGPVFVAAVLLTLRYFLSGIVAAISNIHVVSLRQAIVPREMQGRMNASYRFFIYGGIPIGALLGGFLGDMIGRWATLTIGAVGLLASLPPALFSSLPKLRSVPTCGQTPFKTEA